MPKKTCNSFTMDGFGIPLIATIFYLLHVFYYYLIHNLKKGILVAPKIHFSIFKVMPASLKRVKTALKRSSCSFLFLPTT